MASKLSDLVRDESRDQVYVKVRPLHPMIGKTFPLLSKPYVGCAGYDICAAIDAPKRILPGEICPIPAGFALAIPPGYEGQIRPRSGMSLKTDLRIANAPGTIDAGYTGEVAVLIHNISLSEIYIIAPGDRIAQIIFQKLPEVVLSVVDSLPITDRGQNGFGSSGV